jgi:hypothetical protein
LGILAPFPVATSVLAGFSLVQDGIQFTRQTMSGVLRGLPTFAVFLFTLAVSLEPLGIGPSFGVAIAFALCAQALMSVLSRRRNRGRWMKRKDHESARPVSSRTSRVDSLTRDE